MLSVGIFQQPYTVIPTILVSDYGLLGHLWSQNDVIMSWLRLTATSNCSPHPYKTHTKCLGAMICCSWVYGGSRTHYTHPTWLRFWGSKSLVGKNDVILSWSILTATSNCFLHPYQTHRMDFEHIDMLSIGIWQQPYTVIPTLLGSDFGVLGHLWSRNDVIMSSLRLMATSNCFWHLYLTCTKCLSTLTGCPQAYFSTLTQLYPPYLAQILGLQVTCGVKMMSLCHG